MKPVILYYPTLQKDFNFYEWVGNLSNKVKLMKVTSFQDVKSVMKMGDYTVYILLTNSQSFPANWQFTQLQADTTLMILAGFNKMNMVLLNSFLDSLDTYVEPSPDNSSFYRSLDYLDDNLCDNELSLEKVASHAYVSKCHYSRIFQQYVGKGFKEYVINKRIQKAKVLLKKGETVTDVCFSIGYNDLTHFGRMFKKIVGINPSQYRNQYSACQEAKTS
ncbi:AraC-type DNA-binding protein [Fictibacillus solisalsi]|uniref:AraC-type DNA-binding protein n=1 Tax=Fictibacillus solisalsi TaxID=459525 RepID=A0A1H0BPG7_9BACL|nr:AraC family transcriptional regulator [Fictibacillus solisalsi]SDN47537.1 AraC-type DNA-binding protein [Fictibacillus solisalsi]